MSQQGGGAVKRRGKISASGDVLWITFPFSKKRFERIKRLSRASYNKEQRRWELPLLDLPKIQSLEQFRPHEILYDLEEPRTSSRLALLQNDLTAALERLQENPFFVSQADIALIDPEIVISLADRSRRGQSPGLRAKLRPYSKANRFLEEIRGAHYLTKERCYSLPSTALSSLLKRLRDRGVSFAVEQETGRLLKSGAAIRARAESGDSLSAEELHQAHLYPFVEFDTRGTAPVFVVHGATNEQLRDCVPEAANYSERKRIADGCNEIQFCKLLYFAELSQTSLWLTESVVTQLQRKSEEYRRRIGQGNFPQGCISVVQVDAAWVCSADSHGCLYLSDEQYKHQKPRLLASPFRYSEIRCATKFSSGYLCEVADHELPQFASWVKDTVFDGEVPQSLEFVELFSEAQSQGEKRARQKMYQTMADADVPEVMPELRAKLYPHQRVAIAWLLENEQAFLGDDMGLGKTLTILALFHSLTQADELDFMLVVCPNSLVKNWQREAEQWTPSTKLLALPSTKQKRISFLRKLEQYGVDWVQGVVINFETLRLPDVFPVLARICAERRTLLCVDESQRSKNPQSKTFAALQQIASNCNRRVLLSGTPTPKDVTDIWAQMRILDDGLRLGTNYYKWLEQVAELGNKWSEYAIKKFRKEAVEESIARVHEVLLRRRKDDVLSLPEKIFTVRDIELKGEQKKRYDEVRKALLLRVSTTDGKTYVREIETILEEFLRAVQVATNPRLIDETWQGEPAKFLELDEIVREVVEEQNGKLVIWTNYRRNVEELVVRYEKQGSAAFTGNTSVSDRAELIELFQKPGCNKLNILVAIPAAGGVGITLTAAQTAVYLDKTWNAEHWLQSVDRLHRIGQTGTVNILSLHASLVDDIIYKNLRRKQADQAHLLGDDCLIPQQAPSRSELIDAVR